MDRVIELQERLRRVRRQTSQLCDGLEIEDFNLQAIPEASPLKWHLAHTTWFFETFLLKPFLAGYRDFNPSFAFLFNSYYEGVGPYLEKVKRGLLSRPGLRQISGYRQRIDENLEKLWPLDSPEIRGRIRLGIAHEEQHQELMLTDIKAAFAANPIAPAYHEESPGDFHPGPVRERAWIELAAGMAEIGADGSSFGYDNEKPRHPALIREYRIGSAPVRNRDYLEFIHDGCYRRPELWLSDGWAAVNRSGWSHPLYWRRESAKDWSIFTLSGWRELALDEPVCHVSYYEADAFARWSGGRLPTEAEWEHAYPSLGHIGQVWEWTASPYLAYPGFRPLDGRLGEYNAKFMCNQFVLRGGSRITPAEHATRTYRNYFHPETRWQFSGIRLAQEVS